MAQIKNNVSGEVVEVVLSKEVKEKMRPTYKGDGVAVWVNKDKNGREYLAIKLVGHSVVAAFLPKAEDEPK